jgi:hypothetical protein
MHVDIITSVVSGIVLMAVSSMGTAGVWVIRAIFKNRTDTDAAHGKIRSLEEKVRALEEKLKEMSCKQL